MNHQKSKPHKFASSNDASRQKVAQNDLENLTIKRNKNN